MENFDDGDIDDGLPTDWYTTGSYWAESSGELTWTSNGSQSGQCSNPDLTYDDFTAEFDLMADDYYLTNYWPAFAFCKTNYSDWYNSSGYMVYYRYNGSIELHEAGAGVLATSNTGLDLSTWRHVKIVTSGSAIAVYVDGNLEISHSDGTYTDGYFGLNVFGVAARYDDLEIRDERGVHYIRDVNGDVLAEYNEVGDLLAEYVYANGQRIAKLTSSEGTDIYLNDHLGSARAMTGSGWSANYYPFGEVASQTGSGVDTRFDFAGQVGAQRGSGSCRKRDEGTGLMYFGARYYDPEIGRWLSIDRFAPKYPSLTPYQYAANNPINLVDVNGDSIWINYTDSDGNYQRLFYTPGIQYTGSNDNLARLVNTLNTISSVTVGSEVIGKLIESQGNYNVTFGHAIDPDAGGQFVGTRDGLGGELTLVAGFSPNVEKVAHEFFHAYQHESGSRGGSALAEVESALFAAAVATQAGEPYTGIFGIPGTRAGDIYSNSMFKALYSQSFLNVQAYFYSAVSLFLPGSTANRFGLYSRPGVQKMNPNSKVVINKLYPLLR